MTKATWEDTPFYRRLLARLKKDLPPASGFPGWEPVETTGWDEPGFVREGDTTGAPFLAYYSDDTSIDLTLSPDPTGNSYIEHYLARGVASETANNAYASDETFASTVSGNVYASVSGTASTSEDTGSAIQGASAIFSVRAGTGGNNASVVLTVDPGNTQVAIRDDQAQATPMVKVTSDRGDVVLIHSSGDVELGGGLHSGEVGVILYSPNGTRFRMTVSNAGAAVFTAL